jgi:two-component system CheB/CheR fusion protein
MAKSIKEKRTDVDAETNVETAVPSKPFPVVAIGGSAGSFASFEGFFANLPADSGIAFVIIMHLDPHYKSQLTAVMQRFTKLPVTEAIDGLSVKPNQIYIIPPNKDMGIHNRRLLLLNPSKPNGVRQPIDYFLQSLADDQWNRAVAIIFSGMGSDGKTGIRMVKEKLGMTMVQDPATAEYDSMPLAAIGTNAVDFVLSPEEMPVRLIQYLNHPMLADETSEQQKAALKNTNAIQKILMLLRSQTGNDFSLYKKSTVTRRIDRRIAFLQLTDYDSYVTYIQETPQEANILFNELLIGVTKFFRDAPAFDSLQASLAKLIADKKNQEPIRVWVTGCSTGEEAYSVAMLLIECLDQAAGGIRPQIQLYATDVDASALEQARNGVYHDNIVADVSVKRLDRFFIKQDTGYRVKKELRELIVFAQQNLVKDAPFIRLDLLCCRNMLIYFTTDLQRKIIPLFYYALNPKGIMLMGPAETIGGFTDLFTAIDPKWKLFERKEGQIQLSKFIDFPAQVIKPVGMAKAEEGNAMSKDKSIVNIFNKTLIEQFTPASVLVNEKGDILYSNGKTGKYLQLPVGEATMNIHRMAREELKYLIGNSIDQALLQKTTINVDDITLKEGDKARRISLKATPVREPGMQQLVLIVFEDHGLFRKSKRASIISANAATEDLEKELLYIRQRLNNTIKQMETSLEELKSANEELQSTNEEALTTKEEMQSLNEELMTINMQYQSKEEELTRVNDDMKNILDATEIGTIFLDNALSILRYTPQVRKLFNLIPTDVGRPFSHVVTNFEQPFNENTIKEVIDKLLIKELDGRTKTREWYRVRIMPYRTLDNFISGAVLTFTLITDYKQLQSSLQVLQEYSAGLIDKIPQAIAQLDAELKVTKVNNAFATLFDARPEMIIGIKLGGFLRKHWQTELPDELINQCLQTRQVENTVIQVANKSKYGFTVQPFLETYDNAPLIVVTIDEK